MSYEQIDPTIESWCRAHGLFLHRSYQDEEVRSVEVRVSKKKCQIWIEAPDQKGTVQVHVWDYRKKRRDYTGSVKTLAGVLEDAHATAMDWMD